MNIKGLTILSVFLFTVSSSILYGQGYKPSKIKEYMSLTNKVHILSFFIDTKHDSWEEEEIDYYYKELINSQEWLSTEASYWDKDLEFDNEYFFMDNKSVVYLEEVPRRTSPKRTIKKIMNEINYDDFDQFLDENRFDLSEEKLKVVIFVKSNNRSHAYNYWSVKDMDLAVIYCKSTYGMLTNQYVISHEMLHQFGAWDLYYEKGKSQTEESGKKALEEYPNSIMINTWNNQESLEIDEVTAARIGWTQWDAAFNFYDPKVNKEKIMEEREEKEGRGKTHTIQMKKSKHN